MLVGELLHPLKLTYIAVISPLKMDGWNTTFLLGRLIFRGYVSFRGCSKSTPDIKEPDAIF